MCKYCDAFKAEALKEEASSSSSSSSAGRGKGESNAAPRRHRQRHHRPHQISLISEFQQLHGTESQDDYSGASGSSFVATIAASNQNANSDPVPECGRREQERHARHAQHQAGSEEDTASETETGQSDNHLEAEEQQLEQQEQHQHLQHPHQQLKHQQHVQKHSKLQKNATKFCISYKGDDEDSLSQGAWSASGGCEGASGGADIGDETIGQLTGCLEDCEIIDLESLLELPSEEIDFPPPHEDGDAGSEDGKKGATPVTVGAAAVEGDDDRRRRRKQQRRQREKTRHSRGAQTAAGDEEQVPFDNGVEDDAEKETAETESEIEGTADAGEAEDESSLYDCEPDNENEYFILPEI